MSPSEGRSDRGCRLRKGGVTGDVASGEYGSFDQLLLLKPIEKQNNGSDDGEKSEIHPEDVSRLKNEKITLDRLASTNYTCYG